MFVLLEWDWVEELMEDSSSATPDNQSVGSRQLSASNSTQQLLDDMSDSDSIPAITHTVLFKCIGTDKERRYQEVSRSMCLAAKKHGEGTNVLVKLEPEPNDRYDNKAVTFICKVDSGLQLEACL